MRCDRCFCTRRAEGCDWEGEYGALAEHTAKANSSSAQRRSILKLNSACSAPFDPSSAPKRAASSSSPHASSKRTSASSANKPSFDAHE